MRTKSVSNKRINIVTLGCSKNIYDSEVLMGQLKANGKEVVHEGQGEIVVVNTCGFIDNAKEESVDTILNFAKQKEEGRIEKLFVTGCLSERYKPQLEAEITNVDAYFGTQNLPLLLKALGADYKHELVGERLLATPQHFAYLKISEGCDRPCSFCAIPLMRGGHRSKPVEELVKEAENLAAKGVKELILIAQDSTYYGLDLYKKRSLHLLLEALCKVDGIEWIRLHYAFPSGFPEEILEVMAREPKICNYLDIPLQHISDPILKSMKRGTTRAKTDRLLDKIRASVPGIAIRTTLIVGYPGETEEHFQEMLEWVEKQEFDRLGCFTYSHEEDTTAYELNDSVPEEEKQQRAEDIMDVQAAISMEKNQAKIGKEYRVIIDRKEGDYFIGRTEHDSPEVDNEVLIPAHDVYLSPGQMAKVKILEAESFDLKGELVE